MATNPLDRYENLPGVRVEYENGNLYSDHHNLDASTKSLLIIGTAPDGPVGEPVSVQAIGGPKAAEKLFGGMMKREEILTGEIHPETGEPVTESVRVPHEGTLIRAMYEAIRGGNEDIRLLRIDGRRAKTELQVQSINEEVEQTLGVAAGNIAFSRPISITENGRLSHTPIKRITEKTEDGQVIAQYQDQNAIKKLVLDVDRTAGQETIFFNANVFRPGNKIEVEFNFNKRNYHEVLYSDDAGKLNQDPTDPTYFSSKHRFFSDDIAAGHTINVFVDGIAIPAVNSKGEWLWRVGKGDPAVTDPLHDMYTELEYEQGGIRFTEAYLAEVDAGNYPALNPGVEVAADYFYYDEVALTLIDEYNIIGNDTAYTLDYLPLDNDIEVFYEVANEVFVLKPKTQDNPDGQYSMIYPSKEGEKARIVVTAGAVPVGLKIKAKYKTGEITGSSPKLIVEGLYAGEVYGSLKDPLDPESIQGVAIDIRPDYTPDDPTGREKVIYFIKPEDKKLTTRDEVLEYRTRELKGIRTLDEFANYVNNDPRNNIVYLSAQDGDKAFVQGIKPTNGPVYLGQIYNETTDSYELYVDDSKTSTDPDRYPWLGTNGFFDRRSLKDMAKLYDILGGKYDLVPGTIDQYELVTQGVYSKLENYAVDSIVMVEAFANTPIGRGVTDSSGSTVYIEDPDKNFATQLAQHCAVATAKTWETIGFIGVEPVKNATLLEIQEYIDELTNSEVNNHFMYNEATHEYVLNEEGEPIDIGHYVNVVFGPEVGLTNDRLGNYVANGAVIYAALNSTLRPEVATTNKEVNIHGLRYHLSEAQHDQLIQGRFVTFEERITESGQRLYKVKDGVTAGQPNSDYQRLSTVNITHAAAQLVRMKAEPFIGMPNGLAQRNALATEIQAGLDRLKEEGVLQDFSFSLFTNVREKVLGNAFITLELVPEFETRRIYTSVGLRQSI